MEGASNNSNHSGEGFGPGFGEAVSMCMLKHSGSCIRNTIIEHKKQDDWWVGGGKILETCKFIVYGN